MTPDHAKAEQLAIWLLDQRPSEPTRHLGLISHQQILARAYLDLRAKLEALGLPEHRASLHLTHNDHKSIYSKLEDWIRDNDWCDWEGDEAKRRAIETDECWTLQWYPDTPVGFCAVAAPTLAECLALANGEKETTG